VTRAKPKYKPLSRGEIEWLCQRAAELEADLGGYLEAGLLDGLGMLYADARDAHAAAMAFRETCQDRLEDLAEGEAASSSDLPVCPRLER
jgi:hypothetical protein